MDENTKSLTDDELLTLCEVEAAALEKAGTVVPLTLRPMSAVTLLGMLQFYLRFDASLPSGPRSVADFAKRLATLIESQVSVRPGIQELVRRGWEAPLVSNDERLSRQAEYRAGARGETEARPEKESHHPGKQAAKRNKR